MSLLLAITAAGGPTNYTLTCAAGSYTYTGQAATLKVSHSLTCSAGAYTYAGQAATLKVAHSLVCNPGAYSYVGQTATLKVAHSLTCAAGAYNYVGNAAILAYVPGVGAVNYTLACSAGAYTYTGMDATLLYVAGLPKVIYGGSLAGVHYADFVGRRNKARKDLQDEIEQQRLKIEQEQKRLQEQHDKQISLEADDLKHIALLESAIRKSEEVIARLEDELVKLLILKHLEAEQEQITETRRRRNNMIMLLAA